MNIFKSIKKMVQKVVETTKSVITGSIFKKPEKPSIQEIEQPKKKEIPKGPIGGPSGPKNSGIIADYDNREIFKRKQEEHNEAIKELSDKLEEWEKVIADDNGLLEMERIPGDLLTLTERAEKIEEYNRIIEDAENEIRKKLVKGYDDFLHMITCTIIPDMNEGFMEELREEFKNASLQEKSAFLEEWWKEMREVYDDLKSGAETLWGLEIQQTVAEAMLNSIRSGSYNKTW